MADLGKKHECSECGAKFYDLGKPEPVCPRCGAPASGSEDEPKAKARRKRRPAPAPVAARETTEELPADGAEDVTFAVDDDEIEAEDLEDEDLGDLEDEDEEEDEEDDLDD